jgi:hypothetical protein
MLSYITITLFSKSTKVDWKMEISEPFRAVVFPLLQLRALLQYGEIDCWQMECPPVTCPNPVTEEGDCCPRCEDDPCAREVPANGTSLTVPSHPQPCSYAGIVHDSGSSWKDPYDKCTTCECKVRTRIGCNIRPSQDQQSPVLRSGPIARLEEYG